MAGGAATRAFCVDYAQKTVRTTTAPINCAAKVQHPTRGDWLFLSGADDGSVQRYGLFDAPVEAPGITVTIMGNIAQSASDFFTVDHVGKTISFLSGGAVAITGYVSPTQVTVIGSAPSGAQSFSIVPAIWHRNGQPYASVLESGAGDLGSSDSEKLVNRYVLTASSKSPNTQVKLDFKAGLNPGGMAFIQSAVIPSPQAGHNLVEPTFLGYYVGGRITVCGINNPFELSGQIWKTVLIGSQSAGRL